MRRVALEGHLSVCCLVHGNAFNIFAFTPGAVDQLLGAFQKKRRCGLPSSEFCCRGHESH